LPADKPIEWPHIQKIISEFFMPDTPIRNASAVVTARVQIVLPQKDDILEALQSYFNSNMGNVRYKSLANEESAVQIQGGLKHLKEAAGIFIEISRGTEAGNEFIRAIQTAYVHARTEGWDTSSPKDNLAHDLLGSLPYEFAQRLTTAQKEADEARERLKLPLKSSRDAAP
jgi:septum formation topological specificity factor MinE